MNNSIYKDYRIEHILLDLPCNVDGINIYPIKIIEWDNFQKYVPLLIYSKKHYEHYYNIKNTNSLLEIIILQIISSKLTPMEEKYKADNYELYLFKYGIDSICKLLEMITHDSFKMDYDKLTKNNEYSFYNNKGQVINDNNFDIIRQIVLKQNLLFEPIIYESKFKEKWAESVKRGRAKKSKDITLTDIISIVREGLGISYKEICEMNIFQLYVDFNRLKNTKSFEYIAIISTTYGVNHSKLPNINYDDPIIEDLMRNPELDYFKDFDMGDVVDVLK